VLTPQQPYNHLDLRRRLSTNNNVCVYVCLSTGAQTNFGEVTSVEEWLDNINMAKYVNVFKNAGCSDLEHVKTLDEDDLSKMGVKLIGHRNKINKSIKAMKRHCNKSNEVDC
jgi:hypothetical protein